MERKIKKDKRKEENAKREERGVEKRKREDKRVTGSDAGVFLYSNYSEARYRGCSKGLDFPRLKTSARGKLQLESLGRAPGSQVESK